MSGWVSRVLLIAAVVLLAVSSTLAGVETATAQDDSPTIRVTHVATGQPEPGVVRFETTYDIPGTVRNLSVTPGESERVTVTDGTEFENRSGEWTWSRADSDTTEPTIGWRASVNETDELTRGLDAVGTGRWALFEQPSLPVHYWYSDENPTVDSTVTTGPNTTGYVSGETVYLGQYTAIESQRGSQQYTLVVPAGVEEPPESVTVFDTFEFARRALDVGETDRQVDVFVGPEPLRSSGLRYAPDNPDDPTVPERMWVSGEERPGEGTYYHEYAHTRQAYNESDRMAWITEGQASYYEELLVLYSGSGTYGEFRAGVTRAESASTRLAPANRTAARRDADYAKGPRVLAALDAEIRRATARNSTLEDVWRAMNEHQGRLTYDDFRTIVADVAGESFDDWLDRYLTTPAAPDVPLNRTLYAPVDSGIDSDGDGVDTQSELDSGTNPFATPTYSGGETGQSDDEARTAIDTVVILGSLAAAGLGGVGLVVVGLARLLDRVLEWVPDALSERSLRWILVLTAAAVAVLVGYTTLLM